MRRYFDCSLAAGMVLAAAASIHGSAMAASPALDLTAAKARLEARLQRLVAEDGFEGVVRIDVGDVTILRAGVGQADPVARRPFTADTQVEMGSIGKSFTAAAILKLRDTGRLSLDDGLGKFFPEGPADKKAITLRQLLTHTSGLPMYPPNEKGEQAGGGGHIDRATFEKRVLVAPLVASSGSKFQYSNVDYGLLADIIERVSKRPYEDYLRAEVLIPGGAVNTGYRSAYKPATAATSRQGGTIGDVAWGTDGPYWSIIGAGGMVTTADDMITWRKAFLAGRVVKPSSVAEATTGGVDEGAGRADRYGYGVGLQDHPVYGRLIWHNGGDPWFTSDFRQMPESGVTLFVSTNSRENATSAATKLSRALYGAPDAPTAIKTTPSGGMPAERTLVQDFATALASPDAPARQVFLTAHAGPVFVQREGMAAIEGRFTALHDRLAGAHLEKTAFGEPGQVTLTFVGPQGTATVDVTLGGTPEQPRIAGFSSPG